MKIAVGAPVAERAWVLPSWIDGIRNQRQLDAEVKVFAVYTASNDRTFDVLMDNKVDVLLAEFQTRPLDRIDEHKWSQAEQEYMADLRNLLVTFVCEWDADYFFSLDSDIIIPHNTIATLLETMNAVGADAIAPLVNMEKDPNHHPAVAWNFLEWVGEYAERMRWQGPEPVPPQPFQIDVILAAIFMNRKAMHCRWRFAEGGEDMGWARHADELGLVRYLDPRVTAAHMMTPV